MLLIAVFPINVAWNLAPVIRIRLELNPREVVVS